jgi:hypothetical protein
VHLTAPVVHVLPQPVEGRRADHDRQRRPAGRDHRPGRALPHPAREHRAPGDHRRRQQRARRILEEAAKVLAGQATAAARCCGRQGRRAHRGRSGSAAASSKNFKT